MCRVESLWHLLKADFLPTFKSGTRRQPMSDKDILIQQQLVSIQPLAERLEGHVRWEWDEEFECLLAEFSVDHEQSIQLKVASLFPFTWNRKTIKKAPPILRHRASVFGELEKKQLLFTKDRQGSEEMMVSWWPWGHGATISLRVFRANSAPYVESVNWFTSLKHLLRLN